MLRKIGVGKKVVNLVKMGEICYNNNVKNWSTDIKKIRGDKNKFIIWKLEQLVNFGLGKKKIKKSELKKYWKTIDIDPSKRKFLSLILEKRG